MSLKYTDTVVLVFAKAPVQGDVNTRLIPELGVELATDLQADLIRSRLKEFKQSRLCELQLWCSPDVGHEFFERCKEEFCVPLCRQTGRDLGARMSHAIKTNIGKYKHVVLIGTDAPALDLKQIDHAIKLLHNNNEIVLVPAEDGGYVLIGMNQHYRDVFLSVPWGTGGVLRKTRGNVIALGIKLKELDTCWDIDRIEDYHRYQELKRAHHD